MDRMIRLRAHHLLCALGFRGLGYSHEFIIVFTRIIGALKKSDSMVRLVEGADELCEACPHCEGAVCLKDGTDVLDLDRRVERFFDIAPGALYRASELMAKVSRIDSASIALLCEGCEWLPYGYCTWKRRLETRG